MFKKLPKVYKDAILIIAVTLVSSFVLYMPFLLKQDNWIGLHIEEKSMNTIYKHYDGPLYIVPAKSWYNPKVIEALHTELSLGWEYYAAHLPLYPVFIALFAGVMNHLQAMLVTNLLFTVFLALFFYYFVRKFKLSQKPLLLTIVFLFLPRFFVVRSVGAPESLFILLILLSLFFFEKKNFLLAGLFGGLSVATKTPGLLLFIAYGFVVGEEFLKTRRINWQWMYLLLIPTGLMSVFALYAVQYQNFWAYFNSGDNIHLVAPYSVFNFQKTWVSTAWLEEIIFYYGLYILTVIQLWKSEHRSLFYFSLVFWTATLFVQHRDISRYALPLWPMALIAYDKFFTSKKFLLMLIILLPGIFMYVWNMLLYNVLPISDWKSLL